MKTELKNFFVIDDSSLLDALNPIPLEVQERMGELYDYVKKGRKAGIKKIERLIARYPKVPVLKNLLSVLYSNLGQNSKASEISRRIVKEHPDYLYGKLNVANEYFHKGDLEKMIEVLGGTELTQVFPERDVFHVSEVTSFYSLMVKYYAAIKELDMASEVYGFIKDFNSVENEIEIAGDYLLEAKMQDTSGEPNGMDGSMLAVNANNSVRTDITEPPHLENKELYVLYEKGFDISKEGLKKIIELPRPSLIADLKRILINAVVRYGFLAENYGSGLYGDDELDFLSHALFISAEIEAEECIDEVLEVLRQESDFYAFYFGDIFNEFIWIILYRIARNNLGKLKEFMFEPGIYTFSKANVSSMVNQVALHDPQRKNEVVQWFSDVLSFFISSRPEDNVIDSSLIDGMIDDVMDVMEESLLDKIRALFEKGYALGDEYESFEEVEKVFFSDDFAPYKMRLQNIFEIYDAILSWGKDTVNYAISLK